MIDVRKATESLGGLALLKFFPSDDFARTELLKLVCEMAGTNEQIDWLVKRCRNLWNTWEGPHELRAVFCSKYKPTDGIEAYSDLPRFLDGIPSERESQPLQLGSAPFLRIAAPPDNRAVADGLTASPTIQRTLSAMALSKDLNRVDRRAPKVPDIPMFPEGVQKITAEDIARVERELRDKKAREEAGLEAA